MAPPAGGQTVGFWGPTTATIDWCEANYEVTIMVAELWNTISNLMFVIPPLAAAFHFRGKVDPIYNMSLVYMAFTGIGSCAFHGTLLYSMQLWDELAMAWAGCFILYLIIRIHMREQAGRFLLPLILYGVGTNLIYLYANTPIIFQAAYAVIHISVVFLAYNLKHLYPTDMRLFWASVLMTTAGFILWNLDNIFCDSLSDVRTRLRSSPGTTVLVPLTQFHALWHCLTGYGAFCMVLFVIHAHLFSLRKVFTLSVAPLSGLTLEQVYTDTGAEVLITSPAQQRYADEEDEIVTLKNAPGTSLSNAVSSGYAHMVKYYNNRKRE